MAMVNATGLDSFFRLDVVVVIYIVTHRSASYNTHENPCLVVLPSLGGLNRTVRLISLLLLLFVWLPFGATKKNYS